MAEKTVVISVPPGKSLKIVKWKVRKDVFVSIGQIILLYNDDSENVGELRKFKATEAGTVKSLAALEGETVQPGGTLVELEECSHPTVMKDMCAECGADLRNDDTVHPNSTASVPMVHSVPELKVSEQVAQRLGREDSARLLRDRKLVLLVDLDQTLVHTTNDNIPPNIKDVDHFQLRGWGRWYHSRLRPGTAAFLRSVAALYELHICTFGARAYAHKVARLLDPQAHLFSQRILSRDECFDVHSKTPNLRALFPCGDNLVCIIDDREDVWNRAPNLIQVRPYHFFEHTGDIHAPPGMDKTDSLLEGQGMHIDVSELKEENNSDKDLPVNNGSNSSDDLPQLDSDSLPAPVDDSLPLSNDVHDPPDDSKSSKVQEETRDVNENDSREVNQVETKTLDTTPLEINNSCSDSNAENGDNSSTGNGINESTDKEETHITNNLDANPEPVLNSDIRFDDIDPEKVLEKEIDEITSLNPDDAIVPDDTDMNTDLVQELDNIDNVTMDSKTNDVENTSTDSLNESEVPNPCVPTKWKTTENGMIEVEDKDDYLLYLEDILQRIHKFFYEVYDAMEAGSVPDLKSIIPQVKGQVLEGTSLVFSGLVPTYQKLEHSRAYLVARSLGAQVTQDLTPDTTHLVAVRPGTAKVHACRRLSKQPAPHVVTAGWLWACAERWQRCEERLFPLRAAGRGGAGGRRPPAHCASPPHSPPSAQQRKRTPSGRFMDTINPLLSFSSDDIADMDKEVEDIINASDESDTEGGGSAKEWSGKGEGEGGEDTIGDPFDTAEDTQERELRQALLGEAPSDTESDESLSGGEHPRGWSDSGSRKRSGEEDPEEEPPSQRFRRGEGLPSDAPDRASSDSEGSEDPPDDMDDGDWNMMGAALEREFLGLDD